MTAEPLNTAASIEVLARQVAQVAEARHSELVSVLNATREQVGEMRHDLRRIEGVATDALALARLTNGRVTTLELWRAEMKGIAQGSGSTGRLLLYLLTGAATTGGIITVAMKILER